MIVQMRVSYPTGATSLKSVRADRTKSDEQIIADYIESETTHGDPAPVAVEIVGRMNESL